MPKLNFTAEQRLIISLLCDLYKSPDKREFDPKFIMEAITGGHDWALDWDYGALFPERTDSDEDVTFVTDVLDMWEFIELSWERLTRDQQQEVHDAVPYLGEGPKFIGFDGNNEGRYMAIARMLVDTMGRFATFSGRTLNSHSHKVDRYRQMLARWPDKRALLGDRLLLPDELIDLLRFD